MKKSWSFFWIITVTGAVALIVGGVFAARIGGMLCAFCGFLGAAGWAVFYLHFRTVKYISEKDRIIIRSGFLIRSERCVSKSDILWRTTVKIGSVVLFSVIYTAAGKAVLFACPDCDISVHAERD